ncbi:hypothetical protein PG993_000027 [Apiospora rasikravindrae]|uniref:Nephrocystin 3-like N-terminal domain-containing protein n=1 Tax=Apiospora rasikravindrae TaxID=990691 RepID=A0ABR1U9M3_9PEZI
MRNFIRHSIATREFPDRKLAASKVLDWRTLLPEIPPVRYPSLIKLPVVPFQHWSEAHEQFDRWLDRYHEGLRVVHLYSSSGPPELCERVLQHVQTKQDWAKVIYFRFYPNDSRLNSTRAMLLYLLTQHMRWTGQSCVWPIEALPHAFSLRDLYQCFVDLVWTRNEKRDVWVIIDGIENADEDFAWFLHEIHGLGSRLETPLQLIVISNGDASIMSQLANLTNINLSACPITEQLSHDALMAKTLSSRRTLEEMSQSCTDLILAVPRILEAHSSDPQLAEMTLQWTMIAITFSSFSFSWFDTLPDILVTSPAVLFRTTRDCLPAEQQKVAEDVSLLVRTAFRPLTVDEIASALLFRAADPSSTSEYSDHKRLVEQIHRVLPVLFTLRDGEVYFAHDSIMESQQRGWLFPSASSRHTSMTLICLGFLRLPTTWNLVATLVHERTADNIPGSESRKDFLAYAVNHVIAHYNLCDGKVPIDTLLAFFKLGPARSAWLDALNALSGSSNRKSYRNDLSAFQCAAQTGIADLVTAMVSEQRQSPDFEAECVLAISEAALFGHIAIVRTLLQELGHVVPGLKDTVSAAASHGNDQCLDLLIDFCSQLETFVWPEGLICRAAFLGFGGIVRKLLGIGLALGWTIDYESSLFLRELTRLSIDSLSPREQLLLAPLAISLRFGHGQVVKAVLETESPEFTPDVSTILLRQTVSSGDPDVVRLVVDRIMGQVDSALEDELLQVATDSSSYRAIEALLKAGSDLSWHTESLPIGYGVGPLVSAIGHGYTKCVKHLLDSDLNVNIPHDGKTALDEAVKSRRLEIAEMVLATGADPNIMVNKQSPLITAIDNGDIQMVNLLLDNGADIDLQVKDEWSTGKTALAIAASRENHEVLRALLQRGAQVNCEDPGVWSPLYLAVFHGHLENVKILLEHGAEVDARGREYGSPTPLNAAYSNPEIVTTLLNHNADINYRSYRGTVLYRASEGGYFETVHALLSHETKPDLEIEFDSWEMGHENDSLTPLSAACKYGHTEVMQALLEAGANARHRSRDGDWLTPLHFCFGFLDQKGPNPQWPLLTLILYSSRLDVNEIDIHRRTALHLIGPTTPISFVTALVNAGASTAALDSRRHTPFAKAVVSGNIEVFHYLASRSPRGPRYDISPLRLACAAGNATMVEYLVEAGADVNERDKVTGETPLYALFTGPGASSDLVEYLVDGCGADVNKPGGEFKYPIIKAFTCHIDNHLESYLKRRLVLKIYSNIRLLLRRGADIDAEDDAGRRAVHLALSSLSLTVPWHLFEEFKADLGARDDLGRTALHYVAALGLPSDLEWLYHRAGIDINDLDGDGWTPLMWAPQQRRSDNFASMVIQLKHYGADVWVTAETNGNLWTPLKLARFQGAYTESRLLLLEPEEKSRNRRQNDMIGQSDDNETNVGDERSSERAPAGESIQTWDDEIHETDTGYYWMGMICEGCFTECHGIRWRCVQTPAGPWEYHHQGVYNLCYRCYLHRETLHMCHKDMFEECGLMYEDDLSDPFDPDLGEDIEGIEDDYDSGEETEKGVTDDD